MIIDPRKIDPLLEKEAKQLSRSTGYGHSGKGGKLKALTLQDILDTLDDGIAFGINNVNKFLDPLFWIIAYQSYHIDIDDLSEMPYGGISSMIKYGNPRIDRLERLLNVFDVSLAICKVSDRENDVPSHELQRAMFSPELLTERWSLRDTMKLLFEFGLQFRIFSLEELKDRIPLQHEAKLSIAENEKSRLRELKKIASLLQSFNVDPKIAIEQVLRIG